MTPAIETKDLCKDYRSGFWMKRVRALHPLDLEVMPGEAFGLVGPNGAGKTTTIKILAGLHEPTAGMATLFGLSCSNPMSRNCLGFLPERPYFYTHLTARELLHFYGQLFQMPLALRIERMEMLLERTGMSQYGDVPLGKYSKGMLQRVGLCQALLHDPRLIILDEPMSGLDPLGRAMVRDLILAQKSEGKTILFCSHVLHDVQTICDRVGILVKGDLKAIGEMADIVGDKTLEEIMVAEIQRDTAIDIKKLGVLA